MQLIYRNQNVEFLLFDVPYIIFVIPNIWTVRIFYCLNPHEKQKFVALTENVNWHVHIFTSSQTLSNAHIIPSTHTNAFQFLLPRGM